MDKHSKIVVIGAGVFGLSLAYQLAWEGHKNVVVMDRHMPPVPDGSSNDISRVIRFDYADEDYVRIARQAYLKWSSEEKYQGIFHPAPYILAHSKGQLGESWLSQTTKALTKFNLPWGKLPDVGTTKALYPTLSGELATPDFTGYHNRQAGWADAAKAVRQLRDDCIEVGVSFLCGHAGTVVRLETDTNHTIKAVRTLDGTKLAGDHFVLAAGAWTSSLVPMHNSTLSTGQVVAYMKLSEEEMRRYKDLPIYMNFTSGWFNFPPHEDTGMLKMAVHGWGYTREASSEEKALVKSDSSAPPLLARRQRADFAPIDGESRLRQGLIEILPELAKRPFDKVVLCWYTDTPTGDFIMDYHPDYQNLFVAGGGSGHAFKFLPVLGEYTALAFKRRLPQGLAQKWRFRTDYKNESEVFKGDGSRGGPKRRELQVAERAKL